MKKLVIFILVIFSLSLITSCQSSNQCKRYHKKQKKRKRMSETITQKDAIYENYITV